MIRHFFILILTYFMLFRLLSIVTAMLFLKVLLPYKNKLQRGHKMPHLCLK